MSPEAIEDIVKKAVRDAMREEFFSIGLLTHDPEDKVESRKDMGFLRACRLFASGVAEKVGYAFMFALLGIVLWLMSFVKGPWPKV